MTNSSAVGHRLRCRLWSLSFFVVEENQVEVAVIIQIAATELAQADDRPVELFASLRRPVEAGRTLAARLESIDPWQPAR